ncbi:hypothetical protein COO60DRAFT_783595 [Scenedesmus sp. NREL 46B-D3]|nr:hypothetical protein COO60DRAFT_783595 [Scenedesmus sp. NREL 46B-D3]
MACPGSRSHNLLQCPQLFPVIFTHYHSLPAAHPSHKMAFSYSRHGSLPLINAASGGLRKDISQNMRLQCQTDAMRKTRPDFDRRYDNHLIITTNDTVLSVSFDMDAYGNKQFDQFLAHIRSALMPLATGSRTTSNTGTLEHNLMVKQYVILSPMVGKKKMVGFCFKRHLVPVRTQHSTGNSCILGAEEGADGHRSYTSVTWGWLLNYIVTVPSRNQAIAAAEHCYVLSPNSTELREALAKRHLVEMGMELINPAEAFAVQGTPVTGNSPGVLEIDNYAIGFEECQHRATQQISMCMLCHPNVGYWEKSLLPGMFTPIKEEVREFQAATWANAAAVDAAFAPAAASSEPNSPAPDNPSLQSVSAGSQSLSSDDESRYCSDITTTSSMLDDCDSGFVFQADQHSNTSSNGTGKPRPCVRRTRQPTPYPGRGPQASHSGPCVSRVSGTE